MATLQGRGEHDGCGKDTELGVSLIFLIMGQGFASFYRQGSQASNSEGTCPRTWPLMALLSLYEANTQTHPTTRQYPTAQCPAIAQRQFLKGGPELPGGDGIKAEP